MFVGCSAARKEQQEHAGHLPAGQSAQIESGGLGAFKN